MLRKISNNDDFDDEVTFNKQDAKSSIFVTDNDDSDNEIVYHRKYLQKSNRRNVMDRDKDGEINSTEPAFTGVKKEDKSIGKLLEIHFKNKYHILTPPSQEC